MSRNFAFFLFLLCHTSSIIAQTKSQYSSKANETIKNFITKLNIILDRENSDEKKRTTSEVILNEMIVSRERTFLYDNISDSVVQNNQLSGQNFIDRLIIFYHSKKTLDTNTYKFEYGSFLKDTNYLHRNDTDYISNITYEIKFVINPENSKQVIRTDTITFIVVFQNKRLDDRRILSSFKFKGSLTPEIVHQKVLTDSDFDNIEDNKDACPNIAGPDYCFGCPDRDSDGVCDGVDVCPDTPGHKKHNGCPAPILKELPKITDKNLKKELEKIAVSFKFDMYELLAMNANTFELSYSKMNLPLNPELSDIETVVFHIKFTNDNIVNIALKQLISIDGQKLNLNEISNSLYFLPTISDLTSNFEINLKDQNELNTFLQKRKFN